MQEIKVMSDFISPPFPSMGALGEFVQRLVVSTFCPTSQVFRNHDGIQLFIAKKF